MTRNSSARASAEDAWRVGARAMEVGWSGVPERPRQFLPRGRLLDALDADPGASLLLVSAPAGTGKTTLVADWVSTRSTGRTEWITFEAGEPFWPGLVGCLDRLGVPVSVTSLPVGGSALDVGVRRAIASAIAAAEERVTVVVDGYEVDSAAVARDLDFLLRHTGHRLRLVLLTRADPVMSLYRYRLEQTMTEMRMADLAFTDDEAEAMLGLMGVGLATSSVSRLNARTKGWVTGLRFAGKMLADREDPDSAVEQVVGDTGSIAEYLMGEVLAVHPPEVRELLMATSIPDSIQPGLAEALAGRSAARTLAFLVRVNVFIENVPGHAGHYRYHPFFRDLLRAELEFGSPETMVALQRRAGEWFAEQGLLASAVRHFASAGAWEEAASQVVDNAAVGQLVLEHGSGALAETLRAIPAEVEHPAATVVRASLALTDGDTVLFNEQLGRVQARGLDSTTPQAPAINLAVAVLVAIRARFSEDPAEAEVLAKAAEEALGEASIRTQVQSHPELVALVLAAKGIAMIRKGDLAAAEQIFEAGAAAAVEAVAEPLLVECLGYLALLALCTGDVARSEALAVRAIRVARDAGIPVGDRSAAAHVALAWVEMERFDLRAAADHVRSAERSDFIVGDPVPRTMLTIVKSRLQVAQGDRAGARARLSEAAAGMVDPGSWLAEMLRVEHARLLVAAGEPDAALAQLEGLGQVAAAEVALVVGQAKLELGDEAGATQALGEARGAQAPVPVQVAGWLVECGRKLHAGSTTRARETLATALQLSATMTLRRPFHEAPGSLRQLLVQDQELARKHAWVFDVAAGTMPRPLPRRPAEPEPRSAPVETLTAKELEVLGYLADLLTTEEIAAAMYISVNTVRTHVRNILRKLGVSRRNAAVRAARKIGLLPV